jgi:hypothetical protein
MQETWQRSHSAEPVAAPQPRLAAKVWSFSERYFTYPDIGVMFMAVMACGGAFATYSVVCQMCNLFR